MRMLNSIFVYLWYKAYNIIGKSYREVYLNAHPEKQQKCACCGKILYRGKVDFTIDRILPRRYGGTDDITNLQPMCRSCNSRKRDKIRIMSRKRGFAWLPGSTCRKLCRGIVLWGVKGCSITSITVSLWSFVNVIKIRNEKKDW